MFRYKRFVAGAIGIMISFMLALGFGFLLPNYAQLVLGTDAFAAGLILVPGCLLGAVLTPLGGRIYDRIGPFKPIVLGGVCFLLCACLYSSFIGRVSIFAMTMIYMLFPLGQALAVGNTMTFGLGSIPASMNADGNAIYNTCQQLSSAVGTAIVTSLVAISQTAVASDFMAGTAVGTRHALFFLAGLAAMFIVVMWIGVKSRNRL